MWSDVRAFLIIAVSGLFLQTVQAGEKFRCVTGQIRTEGKPGIFDSVAADYCVSEDRVNFIEKRCYRRLEACMTELLRNAPVPDSGDPAVNPQFGSPGFRRCEELGGKARFVEILGPGIQVRAALCFFSRPETFVDNDTLFDRTGKRIPGQRK